MSRINWNDRQGPGDFDNTAPVAQSYDFDYTSKGGAEPWPKTHGKIKFGPALIRQAWEAGRVVYAVIDDEPRPIAVKEARWTAGCLEVVTTAGPRIPRRLFTRDSVKGLQATGELVE